MYYKKADAWQDLEPEVINFKTGGVLKSMATDGLIKGDVNGNIKGAHSKTQITTPVEILIYAQEGVAATEYQLLLLREEKRLARIPHRDGRSFPSVRRRQPDAIEFEAKKIAPRTYSLALSKLKPGEYGLMPPSSGDATGSTGRLRKALYISRH